MSLKHLKGKILVIPDVHQDLAFARGIFAKELDWDYVVFLGDYFDTLLNPDGVSACSFKATCLYFTELQQQLQDRAVFLLGNHDLSYLSTYTPSRPPKRVGLSGYLCEYLCEGYTRSKAATFNFHISETFAYGLELCCRVNDTWMLSHAGFSPRLFSCNHTSELQGVQALYDDWEANKRSFQWTYKHWISMVTSIRKGCDPYGSPVWQDWGEFVSLSSFGQIVGHTTDLVGVRKYKLPGGVDNYCIDGHQTTYMIILPDGTAVPCVLEWQERNSVLPA